MVFSLDRWVGKVAIVTGASSGIGAAIAERLVIEGLQVVALARREDRLIELAKRLASKKGKLHPFKTDITSEEDILKAFKWTTENLGPIHILVNNAGVMPYNSLHAGDTKVWQNVINVNVLGLCIATREAVKDMRANNVDGHIIHINSIGGHKVPNFPGLNVCPATKFAVRALAETLRLELNSLKSKIKITNLSPGGVKTKLIPEIIDDPVLSEAMKTMPLLKAEDIAEGIVYVLSTPPHVRSRSQSYATFCYIVFIHTFVTNN